MTWDSKTNKQTNQIHKTAN